VADLFGVGGTASGWRCSERGSGTEVAQRRRWAERGVAGRRRVYAGKPNDDAANRWSFQQDHRIRAHIEPTRPKTAPKRPKGTPEIIENAQVRMGAPPGTRTPDPLIKSQRKCAFGDAAYC
jgi:hypothetical protein